MFSEISNQILQHVIIFPKSIFIHHHVTENDENSVFVHNNCNVIALIADQFNGVSQKLSGKSKDGVLTIEYYYTHHIIHTLIPTQTRCFI